MAWYRISVLTSVLVLAGLECSVRSQRATCTLRRYHIRGLELEMTGIVMAAIYFLPLHCSLSLVSPSSYAPSSFLLVVAATAQC
ncbi:hypothetical protein V8C42DRAFT_9103 [Trichoderma barbatum]